MDRYSCPENSCPTPIKETFHVEIVDLDTYIKAKFWEREILGAWACHLVTIDMNDVALFDFIDKECVSSYLVLVIHAFVSFSITKLCVPISKSTLIHFALTCNFYLFQMLFCPCQFIRRHYSFCWCQHSNAEDTRICSFPSNPCEAPSPKAQVRFLAFR